MAAGVTGHTNTWVWYVMTGPSGGHTNNIFSLNCNITVKIRSGKHQLLPHFWCRELRGSQEAWSDAVSVFENDLEALYVPKDAVT